MRQTIDLVTVGEGAESFASKKGYHILSHHSIISRDRDLALGSYLSCSVQCSCTTITTPSQGLTTLHFLALASIFYLLAALLRNLKLVLL